MRRVQGAATKGVQECSKVDIVLIGWHQKGIKGIVKTFHGQARIGRQALCKEQAGRRSLCLRAAANEVHILWGNDIR